MDLLADGWNPLPFRELIVTVDSRCDLSCDYCYTYGMADQSWRERPSVMSSEIANLADRPIGEHARSHDLDRITLILYGGEPLLTSQNLVADWSRRAAQRSLYGDGSGRYPNECSRTQQCLLPAFLRTRHPGRG